MSNPDPAAVERGLERIRAELITGKISPDACIALMTIVGSVDVGRRVLAAEIDASETFIHGVLLGVLDRAVTELAEVDPQR